MVRGSVGVAATGRCRDFAKRYNARVGERLAATGDVQRSAAQRHTVAREGCVAHVLELRRHLDQIFSRLTQDAKFADAFTRDRDARKPPQLEEPCGKNH